MEAASASDVDAVELENLMEDLLEETPIARLPQGINPIEWDIAESPETNELNYVSISGGSQHTGEWETERAHSYRFVSLEPLSLGEREERSGGLSKQKLQKCRFRIEEELINPSGPVLLSALQSVIAQSFNRQRTSKTLNKSIDRMIPSELIKDDGTGAKFVWPRSANPTTWPKFRASDGERRMDDIPLLEIENAMRHVHRTMDIADEEDLFRKTMQFFGLQRLTSNTSARLERAKNNVDV